ncbi:MAG: NFACT RNA binding domain-containing protein [Bacteroidota bacterium]
MFKNYLYLLRCVHELLYIIKNESLIDIYTQEKDKLFFNISNKTNDGFHLIISTHQQLSYLTINQQHHKARKNVKNFFDDFLKDRILSVSIAENDRVIKINCAHCDLYFLIRGSDSNVILIDHNNQFFSFKKISQDESHNIHEELKSVKFCFTPDQMLLDLKIISYNDFIKKYRFVDKDIKRELELRDNISNDGLNSIINEIINEEIAVYIDDELGTPVFQPKTFYKAVNLPNTKTFDNYFDAVNYYFTLKYSGSREKNVRLELEKYLDREIERVTNKLNNIKSRLDTGSKEDEYYRHANLLLSSIKQIRKGMKSIELDDFNSGRKVKIVLDEKLSPDQNVNKMFDKAKSERLNFEKSKELYAATRLNYDKLMLAKNKLDKSESMDELNTIKKELKLKTNTDKDSPGEKISFKHFIIEDKYHAFVGRDSKNNDLLTTRFAKQNDLWFHARGVSGSHVVLRVDNPKETVPKNIIKKTASLAAFHSKAKTSKLTPVAYTFKKYVVKKKDLNPGQVYLLREEVIMVPPEIPKDCEMVVE